MAQFPLAPDDYRRQFASEAAALRAAYLGVANDAPVASCPGWDATGLVVHIAQIHHRVAAIVAQSLTENPDPALFAAPEGGDVLAFYDAGVDRLRDAFTAADPTTPVVAFSSIATAAFWMRRMTHETMVHAFDLEELTGGYHAPPVAVVADGVDEFISAQLMRKLPNQVVAGLKGSLALRAVDADVAWLLELTPSGVTLADPRGDAATTLSGDAIAILSFLWRRPARGRLDRTGDLAVLDAYQAIKL